MTRLMTDSDRVYVLEQLKLAPDSVLADAYLAWDSLRAKAVAVQRLIDNAAAKEPVQIERQNVTPGLPSIGKIGATTKDELLKQVAQGIQPNIKYAEHMKLLWARGEVKFDGKEFYL